jgi:dienelactone hydrolase
VALSALLLAACSSPLERIQHDAARGGLARIELEGTRFRHVAFASPAGAPGPLLVFIDGDGTPWTHHGRVMAADPTPRQALALALAVRSAGHSVLYLGRPCYLGRARTSECQPGDWTFARYSSQVVASLAAATNRFSERHGSPEIVLVGHSGGGTLAVLMAPQVHGLRAVVTIGANLDVAAWTLWHGYLPLTGSLDPADGGAWPAGVTEIHLTGGRDLDVPPALLTRYLAAHPAAQVWEQPQFDHHCCWSDAWPQLLATILARIAPPPDEGGAARSAREAGQRARDRLSIARSSGA